MTTVCITLVVVTSVAAALVGDRALDPDFRRHVRARRQASRLRQHRAQAALPDSYSERRRRELVRSGIEVAAAARLAPVRRP